MRIMQAASSLKTRTMSVKSRQRIVLDVCVQTALNMLGMGIISPVLPIYASSLHINLTLIGVIVAAFPLARLFVNIPAGHLGERVGFRALLTAGPLILSGGAILNGIANGFWLLVISRLIVGAGSAVYTTTAMSYLAQISPEGERGRVMGYLQGSMLLGVSVGPAIGGYLADHVGYRAPFFILSALAGIGALWTYWRTQSDDHEASGPRAETAPSHEEKPQSFRGLIFERNLILANLITFALFFTRGGAYLTIIPLLGYNAAHLTSSQVGMALTGAAVLNLITIFTSGKQADHFGRKRIIVLGIVFTSLALILFWLTHDFWSYFACAILFGLGTGIIGPAIAAHAADSAPAGRYGVAMGVYRTYGDAGYILAPVLMGWLGDFSRGYALPLFFNATVMALTGLLFGLKGRESARRRVSVERVQET